jgi:hypothetical protein
MEPVLPIEDMTLEQLQQDITQLSDEQLLEYVQGTRNNRNTAPPPKAKRASKKKQKMSPQMEELAALIEATGLSAEDLENLLNGGTE